jgi:HlyD family secretion protein
VLSHRRRIVVIALAVAAVVALASRAFVARDAGEPRFQTEPASRGTLVASITATGTVNPLKTVEVGTYVSGPVQALDVDFNSPVQRGQRVAKIDPRPFELRVRQAEAALANAHARVARARADLGYKEVTLARNRRLHAEGIVAQDQIDTGASAVAQARAEVALQEAEVRQAEAALDEARVNLGYTDIVSPVDGVVVARNVDVGQTVAASFQTPTLFLIAEDLTRMQVNANVSEADIGHVREGQPATFTVDAFPDRPFEGIVEQVRNAPLNVQNVITYDVVIDVANPDLALRPGMTANVEIAIGRRDDALRVPTRALRFHPPAETLDGAATAALPSGPHVWVLAGDRPRPVGLETGLADDTHTEVRGGPLAEGDLVIVGLARRPDAPAAAAAPLAPRPLRAR